MVKLAAITIAVMSVLPSLVVADACVTGIEYCGYNLLYKGHYRGEILDELARVGLSNSEEHVRDSIFYCGAGGVGWITFEGYCSKGCHNGGAGVSDYCN